MAPTSAIPGLYYAIFAFYEPLLCWLGFLGALADPKATHDMQAPWPGGAPPPGALPRATFVTIVQLGHVCALLGTLNFFVLRAARTHLAHAPALQERLARALLAPLLVGDVSHLVATLWALGPRRWDWAAYEPTTWAVVATGVTLLVPRVCWHLGVGRYVDMRDGMAAAAAQHAAGGSKERKELQS